MPQGLRATDGEHGLAGQRPAAKGRVYHITDGSRTTIGQLAGYVAEQLGIRQRSRVLPYWLARTICAASELMGRRGQLDRSMVRFLGTSRFVEIRRAREELGYAPQMSCKVGIADAVRWMEAQASGRDQRSEIRSQKQWQRVGGSRTSDL